MEKNWFFPFFVECLNVNARHPGTSSPRKTAREAHPPTFPGTDLYANNDPFHNFP